MTAEMQRILFGRRKCMQIQKDTRRLVLNDLIARGDIVGELERLNLSEKCFQMQKICRQRTTGIPPSLRKCGNTWR